MVTDCDEDHTSFHRLTKVLTLISYILSNIHYVKAQKVMVGLDIVQHKNRTYKFVSSFEY